MKIEHYKRYNGNNAVTGSYHTATNRKEYNSRNTVTRASETLYTAVQL